jgi:uncharacterized repeat protein (TIGR01451 family)
MKRLSVKALLTDLDRAILDRWEEKQGENYPEGYFAVFAHGCDADCETGAATLTRRILYIIGMGAALVLLGACARQGQPTAAPTHTPLAVKAAVPTPTPSPSPSPSVEPAGEPLTPALTSTDPGPSAADLAIQVIQGEASVYTLTVRNLGPDPATGIELTDVLPSEVTPLWTEPAQPVCRRQERDVSCDLGNLQAGDAVTVTLDLTVGGSESLITSTQLAGVTLTLSVPVCTIDQNSRQPQVTCRLSWLPPGTEAHVRVGVEVDTSPSEPLGHTATVTANEIDPDRSNNQITSTFAVGAAGPVEATAVPITTNLVIQSEGPTNVTAGQPFTYTYIINNQGTLTATDVWFEDAVPSDMNLVAYTPGVPDCEQQGDAFTCYLRDPDSRETVTLTLVITGHGGQPMHMGLDPLLPGWPICWVIKERTWLHIVQCQLGDLKPGQARRVQLVLVAIGVAERTSVNTASVRANEVDSSPVGSTSTVTITIQAEAEPGQP